jgi:hypothetical protein
MDIQVSRCAAAFIVSVTLTASGCTDRDGTLPGSPFAPISTLSTDSIQVTADPNRIVPHLLSTRDCPAGRSAFRAGFNLIIVAERRRDVRHVVFGFVDSFGNRAVPIFLPTTDGFGPSPGSLPTSVPIPIPSGTVLPIPGTFAFNGLVLNGSRTLPFLLEFRCGVSPAGTLSVAVETTNDRGTVNMSRLNVRIGR